MHCVDRGCLGAPRDSPARASAGIKGVNYHARLNCPLCCLFFLKIFISLVCAWASGCRGQQRVLDGFPGAGVLGK